MKRLHIHVNAEAGKFEDSVDFYTTLFAVAPTKTRPNYAKWMLDDPHVNFVVEVSDIASDTPGIHHVGLQVDDSDSLAEIKEALKSAKAPLLEVGDTVCCFSKSVKNWTMDPSGVRWETFRSYGDIDEYGEKTLEEQALYSKVSS